MLDYRVVVDGECHHGRCLKRSGSLRLPMSVVEPRERQERTKAHDPSRSFQPCFDVPRVRDRIFTLPPKYHPHPKTESNACPDEMTSPQSHQAVEAEPNGGHEGEPIEPYDEREEDSEGPHHQFSVLVSNKVSPRSCINTFLGL